MVNQLLAGDTQSEVRDVLEMRIGCFCSAIPQAESLLNEKRGIQIAINHCCAKRTTVSALRKVRKKKRAATSVKKRGRFARKPAPFLATFSRAFVSRLRHRAGIVRGQRQRAGGATAAFSLAAEKGQPRSSPAGYFVLFGVKSSEKAVTMSRVFCTFFPQKGTQKLPGRCLRLLRPV